MVDETVKNGEVTEGKDEKGRFVDGNKFGQGRPKGLSLTEAIRRRLKELTPDDKRTALDFLADNIIQDALEHNNAMRKLIWNYLDGMPHQSLEIGGSGELPFIIQIVKGNGRDTTSSQAG
jgi:hypothetical protein